MAFVDLGRHFQENVAASVLTPAGQTIAKTELIRGGLSPAGAIEVPGGESRQVLYLASAWFPVFKEGTYRLRLAVPLYARGVRSARIPIIQPEEIEIRVYPHDLRNTRKTCERFFSLLTQSGNYDKAAVVIPALALMEDAAAVPYLLAAVRENSLLDTLVIRGIGSLPG